MAFYGFITLVQTDFHPKAHWVRGIFFTQNRFERKWVKALHDPSAKADWRHRDKKYLCGSTVTPILKKGVYTFLEKFTRNPTTRAAIKKNHTHGNGGRNPDTAVEI
jgi:hypothetical protein